jgi:hypothetical protein
MLYTGKQGVRVIQITDKCDFSHRHGVISLPNCRPGLDMQDKQKLADILKSELTFLEQGGYRRGPRFAWRPNFIFEDSPTCINFRAGERERRPCEQCHLIRFVPLDQRNMRFPCRHIDLTDSGETVSSFYEYGTEEELEKALGNWLRKKIEELGDQDNARIQAA